MALDYNLDPSDFIVEDNNTRPILNPNISTYSSFLINYFNNKFVSDLINCLMFQADLSLIGPSSSSNLEIYKFLKQFVYSLVGDLKEFEDLNIPKKHYFALLALIRKIIDVKEDSSFSFINYSNFLIHFKITDSYILEIVQNVIDNPIETELEFSRLFDSIIQNIQIYNQMQVMKGSIFKWNSFLKESDNELNPNLSPLNWAKNFKDLISEANSRLTELTVLKKNEAASDYLLFYDEQSIKDSVSNILTFLKSSYNVYKTGYTLFDGPMSGIESSSVSIIAGPSNHAKSIFSAPLSY